MNIDNISTNPGCYLMKDKDNNILYIGKAKNLKKRVSQYFNLKHKNTRIEILVEKIKKIETILTSNEKEALLLEANLVKKYKPKYNVLLKDDKHFPYVKLNLDNHPKLEITREVKEGNFRFFGPFNDSTSAYKTIELLNNIFPIRKCKTLPKKACLYYYMDSCLAPCINEIKQTQYDDYIKQITDFYEGKNSKIKNSLTLKMNLYSKKMEYERANDYKKMLDYLSSVEEKQKVDFLKNSSIDFFAIHCKNELLSIVCFIYRNGILVAKKSFFYENISDLKEVFELFLISYYSKNLKPKELVVPLFLDLNLLQQTLMIKVNNYSKGQKGEILKLVGENAIDELNKKVKKSETFSNKLSELSNILNINHLENIDVFDVSHFNGDECVGSKINFFKDGFIKKNYRKYIIKNEYSKNDYLSINEIEYSRLFILIQKEDYILLDLLR